MQANIKEKMKSEAVIGCFVNFALGDIAEMTARIGFDFILIDNEHGVMDTQNINDMIRAAHCQNKGAVVRCTQATYAHIQKSLDMGADGIQVPLVNDARTAEEIYKLAKYPPEGTRGMAFNCRAAEYGMCGDKAVYREQANQNGLTVVQIETLKAIENLDDIIRVPGIDILFVGPGDLSAALGLPDYNQPQVQDLLEKTVKRIADSGKTAGIFAADSESAKKAMDWGARYIVTSVSGYMVSGGKAYLNDIRQMNSVGR